jgi:hypothetical protein
MVDVVPLIAERFSEFRAGILRVLFRGPMLDESLTADGQPSDQELLERLAKQLEQELIRHFGIERRRE